MVGPTAPNSWPINPFPSYSSWVLSLPPLSLKEMADFSAPISLSQVKDISHTSSDNEEENSPRSVPPLSVCVPGADSSRSSKPKITTISNKMMGPNPTAAAEDHHSHLTTTAKKPRGRPPGSKNKPKPPVIITRDSESAMRPAILEISGGSDVVDMIVQYARSRQVGLTILGGSGSVSNITLRSSLSSSCPAAISLHGPLNILSLSGTYLSTSSCPTSSFGITLAGTNGHVYGGIIGGKVMAASDVKVMVATFKDPAFHNLPCDFEDFHEDSPSQLPVAAAPAPLNCHISSTSTHQDMLSWGPSSSRPPPF